MTVKGSPPLTWRTQFASHKAYKRGSPPLTWRTRSELGSSIPVPGITSTYVENTALLEFADGFIQDHLHLRGEHSVLVSLIVSELGSPPLTWRTLCIEDFRMEKLRITSTYVENTLNRVAVLLLSRDHLHLRGEHFMSLGVTA